MRFVVKIVHSAQKSLQKISGNDYDRIKAPFIYLQKNRDHMAVKSLPAGKRGVSGSETIELYMKSETENLLY